jgi:hypothetical protein
MEKRKARRIYGKQSPVSKRQLDKWRAQIAEELPDLIRRNRLADDARKQKTLSGRLRRAVHEYPLSPMKIAEKAGISWAELDDFLTGEKSLQSDVLDRLAMAVKLKLPTERKRSRSAKAS